MSNRSLSLIVLALLVAITPTALAGQLIVNGHEVALEHRLLPGEAGPAAPLDELSKYLGAEFLREGDKIRLRWGEDQEASLPREELGFQDGQAYISMARLAGLLEAPLLSFADAHYLFVPRSELQSLSYIDGMVHLRFSRLAPLEVEQSGEELKLCFYNSVLRIAPRTDRFSQGPVRQVELSLQEPDQVVLRLKLRQVSPHRISKGLVDGGYRVEVTFSADQHNLQVRPVLDALRLLRSQGAVRISPWIGYHREQWETAAGQVRIDYLLVEDYQAHYRLQAALPEGGMGTLQRLREIVQAQGGVAGINANFFDPNTGLPIGLIIRDGQVLSTSYGARAALGIDLFGGLTFFNPRVSLLLQAGRRELKIDGINQPPGKEGLFLYTPHYRSPVRLESEASIYQIGEERVTRGFHRNYLPVAQDSLLLVSLGGQDGLLAVGDAVKLSHRIEPPTFLPLRDAVSAGPLLLDGGRVAIDHRGEGFDPGLVRGRAARSALGVTSGGDLIMLVAAKDSRSAGMNLEELALLIQELGAVDALALDGGSSATLTFRRGFTLRSIGNRRIPTGLVLVPK